MLKKSCPECGSIIEVDESKHQSETTIKTRCQLCGAEMEFLVPKNSYIREETTPAKTTNNEPNFNSNEDSSILPPQVDNITIETFSEEQEICNLTESKDCILQEENNDNSKNGKPILLVVSYIFLLGVLVFLAFKSKNNTSEDTTADLDSTVESELQQSTSNQICKDTLVASVEPFEPEIQTYEGGYTFNGTEGWAKYSYKLENEKCIYDGDFEFKEGLVENGKYIMGGSGTIIASGRLSDDIQDGEWTFGSGHFGVTLYFRDGQLNGPYSYSAGSGYESTDANGTFINGKLVGNYHYVYTVGGENEYEISGEFNSNGKPMGVWHEKVKGANIYYIMDSDAAESYGAWGKIVDGVSMIGSLNLENRILNINNFIFRDTPKAIKQNYVYPTYAP